MPLPGIRASVLEDTHITNMTWVNGVLEDTHIAAKHMVLKGASGLGLGPFKDPLHRLVPAVTMRVSTPRIA